MTSAARYEHFATCISYPGDQLSTVLHRLRESTGSSQPLLERFARNIEALSATEREELYTHTFDINPTASLEVGWQVYGEQYERGTFLVRMRALLREHGIRESGELPDHLSHVLQLLAKLPSTERTAFIRSHVRKAVGKMAEGLSEGENPYADCMAALAATLDAECQSHELREKDD